MASESGEGAPDEVEDAAIQMDAKIRAQLSAIEDGARSLAAKARRLGIGGRGVNGLAAECVVWAKEFEATADKVRDEGPEVSKALLGKTKHEITQTVNPELGTTASTDPDRKRKP